MRFLTLVLLMAAFACKNKPSDSDTSWRDIVDPSEQPAPVQMVDGQPYVFTDTILVSIGPKDFAAVMKLKPNMPIFDLRDEKSYKIGHIWRSVRMDPEDKDFSKRLAGLGRNQEYAIYCAFGDKSFAVAEEMKKMGFLRIYHLQKGLSNWGEAGQALQIK